MAGRAATILKCVHRSAKAGESCRQILAKPALRDLAPLMLGFGRDQSGLEFRRREDDEVRHPDCRRAGRFRSCGHGRRRRAICIRQWERCHERDERLIGGLCWLVACEAEAQPQYHRRRGRDHAAGLPLRRSHGNPFRQKDRRRRAAAREKLDGTSYRLLNQPGWHCQYGRARSRHQTCGNHGNHTPAFQPHPEQSLCLIETTTNGANASAQLARRLILCLPMQKAKNRGIAWHSLKALH